MASDDPTAELTPDDKVPTDTAAHTAAEPAHPKPIDLLADAPDAIGDYAIDHIIGEGGMGTVYLARQKNPDREVALKVIRPDRASRRVLKRFDLEAQLLGRLQHPGIAQIYEAGTFDTPRGPSPYFAMELVRGEPLDRYCESHTLGTRARLELLAAIADAVNHAHTKGIVHRDLKPGNILVTPDAQPKILDFGVARATDADVQVTTIQSDVGQLIGTVPYMSPEQIAADSNAIDARSDVYALGVVLYELLAGRLPYDLAQRMIHEAARVIREDEPSPLSSINRTLRGDVETIVLKALEKDPARRYQTAAEMADDIRRYLDDKPIVARPPSTIYQLKKFARRNKAVVAGVAAVFVVLVAGTAVSTALAVKATRAEQRARDSLAEAEATVEFLDNMLAASDPGAMGKDVTVRAVLDNAAGAIDADFANRPFVAARLNSTIGRTYIALGVYPDAQPHIDAAARLWKENLGDTHPRYLQTQVDAGRLIYEAGEFEQAQAFLLDLVPRIEDALGHDDPITLDALDTLAIVYYEQGRFEEASDLMRRALSRYTARDPEGSAKTILARNSLGLVLTDMGRTEEAERLFNQGIADATRLFGPEHPDTLLLMSNLSQTYYAAERFQETANLASRVLEIQRRILGNRHPITANTINNLAIAHRRLGNLDEAAPLYEESLQVSIDVLGEDHPETAIAQTNVGNFLLNSDKPREALPHLEKSVEIHREAFPEDFYGTGLTLRYYANCLRELDRLEEAESALLEAHAIIVASFDENHRWAQQIAADLADFYDELGRPDDAQTWRARLPEQADAADPE